MAVLNRQWLAVHGIGEQDVGVARPIELKAALEPYGPRRTVNRTRVCAAEDDLVCVPANSGPVQDLDQRDAGPFGSAHGPEIPLLAGNRRIEERPAVARTFQCGDERV